MNNYLGKEFNEYASVSIVLIVWANINCVV